VYSHTKETQWSDERMSTEDTFAMVGLRGILRLAEAEGLPLKRTISAVGLTLEELNDAEAYLSLDKAERLARIIELEIPRAAFFRAMLRAKHGDLGVQEYALRHSRTIREALYLRARYNRLLNRAMDCFFEVSPTEARLSRSFVPSLGGSLVPLACEAFMILTLALLREMTEDGWEPLSVGFPYPRPGYASHLEEIMRCPVLFSSPDCFMSFSLSDIERPIVGADSALQGIIAAHCESMLSKLAPKTAFSDKVRKLLVPLLQSGTPSIEDISKRLGLSPRTFQRRLGDEGTSFRELVEKTQEELALLYLKRPYVTVGELAYLLGFSTHAAFHKAFRRWTNETPGDFRKRSLSATDEPR
jgi:AraC-like DNA-binding protein